VTIPEYLEETILEPGRELKRVEYPDKAVPRIDWEQIIAGIGAGFAELREEEAVLKAKTWLEQTEIRERLLDLDRALKEISREV
jgi:metallo-beta-lactamase family protein